MHDNLIGFLLTFGGAIWVVRGDEEGDRVRFLLGAAAVMLGLLVLTLLHINASTVPAIAAVTMPLAFRYQDGMLYKTGLKRCPHEYSRYSAGCIFCGVPNINHKQGVPWMDAKAQAEIRARGFENDFGVMRKGGGTFISRGPIPQEMGRMQALTLAAWIVRLVDNDSGGEDFAQILRTVRGRTL